MAHSLIERRVVERRQDDILHRASRRDAGNERTHQKPRQRGVAVGEMIDVWLAATTGRWQPQAREARITHVAQVRRRHGVAAKPEEPMGAALEAVGNLLAAAADPDQVVAIARALEKFELFF